MNPSPSALAIAPAFFLISACNASTVRAEIPTQDISQAPKQVQALAAKTFPADGKIHTQRQGRFRMDGSTVICSFRGYGLNGGQLITALKEIGLQPRYVDGQVPADHKECVRGDPIFLLVEIKFDRIGEGYRITMAAWQRDAAWAGILGRDDLRSDAKAPMPDIAPPDFPLRKKQYKIRLLKTSIGMDVGDLGQSLLNTIVNDNSLNVGQVSKKQS